MAMDSKNLRGRRTEGCAGLASLPMANNNYIYRCRIDYNCRCSLPNCRCNRGGEKRQMDLSLLACTGRGLAGRPSREGTPDPPFAGLQAALGSLRERGPILRWSKSVAHSSNVFQRVFPVSLSPGVYRTGRGNVSGFEWQIELIASAIVADHTGIG